MTGALPRVVTPTFEIRCGRTWLTYPDFHPGGAPERAHEAGHYPGLVHGVAVFRDTSFDSDRGQWLERVECLKTARPLTLILC